MHKDERSRVRSSQSIQSAQKELACAREIITTVASVSKVYKDAVDRVSKAAIDKMPAYRRKIAAACIEISDL